MTFQVKECPKCQHTHDHYRNFRPGADCPRCNGSVSSEYGYISDGVRLSVPMGQFRVWHDKLFAWGGSWYGWKFIKGLA